MIARFRHVVYSSGILFSFMATTQGQEISLVPVGASGPHQIAGNQIRVEAGARVFLEMRLSDWDPDLDGDPTLAVAQGKIDASGFTSGDAGALAPPVVTCTANADCEKVLGSGATCRGTPDSCDFGFTDLSRPDQALGCGGAVLYACSTPMFTCGGTRVGQPPGCDDPGVPQYLATIVLDVSGDAAGTFTVGFLDPDANTFLQDANGLLIPLLALTPALITIGTGACCLPTGGCAFISAEQCTAVGGAVAATCLGDGDGDGVDDGCQPAEWIDLCSTPGELDFWTCFDNWDLPGDFYPDNDGSPGGVAGVFVSLPAGADVLLDEDVTIPSLHINEGATLRLTITDPTIGDLSFVDPAFLRIDGTMFVSGNRTIGAPDALVGAVNPDIFIVGPEGVYQKDPDTFFPGVSATIFAFDAFIEPGACSPLCQNGGQVLLSESMSMVVSNDLSVVGSDPVSCSPCVIAGGINPPPKLHGFDSAVVNVGLDVVLSGAVDTVLTDNAILTIGGDFRNETDAPELFDWNTGTVMMTVGTLPRTFEVAGIDFGQSNTGFFTGVHTNYSIGRLEIHNGADVTFVNKFPNLVGAGPCQEANAVDLSGIHSIRPAFRPLVDFPLGDARG